MAGIAQAKSGVVSQYGYRFPEGTNAMSIELFCFGRGGSRELGKFDHLKNSIDLIWNFPRRKYAIERKLEYDPDKHDAFIWNEWTEGMMQGFCENKEVIVAGGGGSWKTTCMALYLLCYWLCSPHNTRVIMTSTQLDGLKARAWKELIHFYRGVGSFGNLVQSRTMIQSVKGDDGAGIFGIAVESDGRVDKAINKIVGRHNARMAVGVDELPTVNNAIVEACVNLETGAEEFVFIGVGNPDSHFDPHGKMAEPENGWGSVSTDTGSWRTRRGGLCIHLYGPRSPRINADDKFPGLMRQRDIDQTASQYGEDSPQMWKQRYGFWAPEGVSKTVLSEADIVRFRAKEKAVWVGGWTLAAGLDPAFEGEDRCVLQIVRFGMLDGGKMGVEFWKRFLIKTKVSDESQSPRHYQIVAQVKEICLVEGVKPQYFGLDSTGEGGGLASIFIREWSSQIKLIEFGGRASNRLISAVRLDINEKPKKAYEEYLNRVTELWYQVRVLLRNGQVRGMDDELAIEFCKRFYKLQGNILVVESKSLMKQRTGKSPDLADAACVAVATVQENDPNFGSVLPPSGEPNEQWRRIAKRYDVSNLELVI